MQTPSLNGERYFITFTNELSGRVNINLLKNKDRALASFKAYRSHAEKARGGTIKALRTNAGGEYLNNEFIGYLVGAGIQHIVSQTYTLTENSIAERVHRKILRGVQCLMLDVQSTHGFWGHSVLTAAHIHNRLPSRSHDKISRMEFWSTNTRTRGHLRVFGLTVRVHVPKERRRKLDLKVIR